MSKEKVFIVASHMQRPSQDKRRKGQWEIIEKVEFVNQLRSKHTQMSSAVIDYLNEKVIIGASKGITYPEFIKYVTEKYPKQMEALQKAYKPSPQVQAVDGEIKIKTEDYHETEDHID